MEKNRLMYENTFVKVWEKEKNYPDKVIKVWIKKS